VNVTRIPLSLLRHDEGGTFAIADDAGRIARAPLQTGVFGRDFVEITAGLKSGTIVLDARSPGGALPVGRRWTAEP
jgi:hypothetical protein